MTARIDTGYTPDGDRNDDRVFAVRFDRESSIPAYQQFKYHIVHAISTGRLAPGDALPSVRRASKLTAMAPATVQRVYGELKKEGILASMPGRHVTVADIEHRAASGVQRLRSLHDLLLPAYVQARSLGYSDGEIVATLDELTADAGPHVDEVRLVFVGSAPETVAKYVDMISRSLPTGVEVVGVDLEALDKSGARSLDDLAPFHLLISLVSTLATVRELGLERGVETFGLTVEPTDETKRILLGLPYGTRVGLVAEENFVSNSRALIEQMCGDIVVAAVTEDTPEARRALAECDITLHTFRSAARAATMAGEGANLVELKVQPMRVALEHLQELALTKRVGNDTTTAKRR